MFCAAVALIAVYRDTLFLPLFLGLLTWGKAILKQLTLKMALMLAKNGFFVQVRSFVVRAFSYLLINSHRPIRRQVTAFKVAVKDGLVSLFGRYMASPLWVRTAIALSVLALTAGSSAALLALLIIPEPLLNWLKAQLKRLSSKVGVTQLLTKIWQWVVPDGWQHRWHMYIKWTLGRRQVRAAQELNKRIIAVRKPVESADSEAA